MSVPAYPAYMNSGVEWLGGVPAHWTVAPLKAFCALEMGQSPASEDCNIEGVGLPFLQGCADFGLRHPTPSTFCEAPQKVSEAGDILLSVRAPVGALNVADQAYGIGRGLCAVRPTGLNPALCRWLLEAATDTLNAEGTGSTYLAISVADVGNLRLPIGPAAEQAAIAAFLDRETGKIDALVEEQRRLIALLKEKRQAVISHAVTKGLNPQVPLKPSGIEWLGDIPAHWGLPSIRHLCEILRGKFTHRPRNDPTFYDGDYPFIQTGDITGASRYITTYRQTLNERGASVSKEFPAGTLVMAIAANLGDVAILTYDAYFPDSIVGLVPKPGVQIGYLYYLMIALKPALLTNATVSTQLNINADQIAAITAIWPSMEEQDGIAAYLDGELVRYDQLVAEAERGIALLQERRAALISAAVTGKIDVRGLVATPKAKEAA